MVDGEFDNLTVNNVLTIGADTELYRSAENQLKTNDQFVINNAGGLLLNLNSKVWDQDGQRMLIQAYNDRLDVINLAGNAGMVSFDRNAGGSGLAGIKFGDNWDVNLYRSAANVLKTDDSLNVVLDINVDGHILIGASPSIYIRNDAGKIYFGTTDDVNLYRSAADVLKTDDKFMVANNAVQTEVSSIYAGVSREVNGQLVNFDLNYGREVSFNSSYVGGAFTIDSRDPTDNLFHWRYKNTAGNETEIMQLTSLGRLKLPVQGSSGGIVTDGVIKAQQDFVDLTVGSTGGGKVNVWDFFQTDYYNNPSVGAMIKLNDSPAGDSNYTSLYGALFTEPVTAPAIVCSHHLIVRKDFLVRGQLDSYEGIVTLHGGYTSWSPEPHNPIIYLARADSYGNYDTLEIRDNIGGLGWGYGNLACGFLTIKNTDTFATRGPLFLTSDGRVGFNPSSARYKENIEDLSDCSWLYDLRPVTFDLKEKEQLKQSEGRQIGLIAEEVHELCPQLTWLDKEGKPEGVHYSWLGIPLLVEFKKLRSRVEALENKLEKTLTAA
jgi:hypothetical protein